MQKSEIRRWAEYKAEVVSDLQRHGATWYLDRYKYALVDTDKRLGDYCMENITHPTAIICTRYCPCDVSFRCSTGTNGTKRR